MVRHPLYTSIKYRAFPTGRDFTFTFGYVPSANSWRAYIQDPPAYGPRPTDMHSTHRLRDEHGWYVCWDALISTLSQCQGVAALWADCTEIYIQSGRFEQPTGRPRIEDRSTIANLQDLRRPNPPTPLASFPKRVLRRAREALR